MDLKIKDISNSRSKSIFEKLEAAEGLGLQVSRRRFIGWAAAATAVIGLTGCSKSADWERKIEVKAEASPITTDSDSLENIAGIKDIGEYGNRSTNGNLLAIQPEMYVSDYASENNYFEKLDSYLKVARREKWLDHKTIAVFPEYIGTWLVLVNSAETIQDSATSVEAMISLVKANLTSVAKHSILEMGAILEAASRLRQMNEEIRPELFRMIAIPLFHSKAREMAEIYHRTFSRLSRKYGITIVAGSIVLPSPAITDNNLVISPGDIYNVSVVYKPDGSPYEEIVRKSHPTLVELPFTARSLRSEHPVFNTPAGKLGILICADAWYEDSYAGFRKKGVDLIACPSYVAPASIWSGKWQGYNPPINEKLSDIGVLTEKEATLKYATGKIANYGVRGSVQTFLRGKLWDLDTDSQTILVQNTNIITAKKVNGAALINLWL